MDKAFTGVETSSSSAAAEAAFAEAVFAVAAHRPEAGEALGRALAADPDHVAALALKGFAGLLLARAELREGVLAALAAARSALATRDGGTADERRLVEALAVAAKGSFAGAAALLDAFGEDGRPALLPFKLAHGLRFMIGDAPGMLAASTRMAGDWDRDHPAAGFLLGCHAFALEEHGRWREAERAGRLAVALEPADAWGLHAVGHVFEMRGRTAEGLAWFEAARTRWSRCNNFAFHIAWHMALLRLERGEPEAALALYDAEVRPTPTDDYRDMANAVSLLWRLESSGTPVGFRWRELAEIARRRRGETTLVFAQLHALIALRAAGRRDDAATAELVAALEALAHEPHEQGRAAAAAGLPFARALAADAPPPAAALDALLAAMPLVGGSAAQRDLFVLALAEVAARAGDAAAGRRIAAARARLKTEDRLLAVIETRARAA